MRILLPTGSATETAVRKAAEGFDADVVITGKIASFLTPHQLLLLVKKKKYDAVVVSGMCTASFEEVERETGVPIYRGPRHAADLAQILPLIGTEITSRTIPADEFLREERAQRALEQIEKRERAAEADCIIRRMKVGGGSRIKVLAEIMDAHRREELLMFVERFFSDGADIVDLGFGFDATPDDVRRVLTQLDGIDRPIAVDTQDPALIGAALDRADLILSLHESNIPVIGREVADAGVAAVVVPGNNSLQKNIALARKAGIQCIIADPLLQPVGSGFTRSLRGFENLGCPFFFGAGNIVELLDADSPGANALLAGIAAEMGAAIIFTSEHSDKTQGSVREMRRATEMMVLARDRPYPKDLGLDLLILKEKRRRREPPLTYAKVVTAKAMPDTISYDPKGNFRIGIEGDQIIAVIDERAVAGKRWQDILYTLVSRKNLSHLDHAGYLGMELYKAELAIRYGRSYEQDGEF